MKFCVLITFVITALQFVPIDSNNKQLCSIQLLSLLKAKKGPTKGKKNHSKITKKKKNTESKAVSESKSSEDNDNPVHSVNDNESSTKTFNIASLTQYLPFASVIVTFILPRFIKLDGLKFQLRLFYGFLLLFTAALVKIIENRINDSSDESPIIIVDANPLKAALNSLLPKTAAGPLAGLAQAAISPGSTTTITTKEYDLVELTKITNSLFTDAALTLFAHFTYKSVHSLLFAISRGVASLLSNQLVLIHVFGQPAVGLLARPFKSQAEQMVANINRSFESSKTVAGIDSEEISVTDSGSTKDGNKESSIEFPIKKLATVEELEEEIEDGIANMATAAVGVSASIKANADEMLVHVNDALRSLTEEDEGNVTASTSNSHDSETAVDADDVDVEEDSDDRDDKYFDDGEAEDI